MSNYSIKDLEKLSGIKAHTIRMWERRYGIIEPHRTPTNIRYYDDEQLKKLLNVSLLVNAGQKISHISKYSFDELNKEILHLYNSQHASQNVMSKVDLSSLIIAMMEVDEEKFERIFSNSVTHQGFFNTIINLIYPFLEKVGIMWGVNDINPAQEHFVSNLIRQKLMVAIDGLPLNKSTKQKFVIFLPDQEHHEIGLLLANYVLRENGVETIYLGQSVPLDDVISVSKITNPTGILFFETIAKPRMSTEKTLATLHEAFPETSIYTAGSASSFEHINIPENCTFINGIDHFLELIKAKS